MDAKREVGPGSREQAHRIVDELCAQFGGRLFGARDIAAAPPPGLAALHQATGHWRTAPKTWVKLLGRVAELSEGRLQRVDLPAGKRVRWRAMDRWGVSGRPARAARQTGRTSKQMRAAPPRAIYVWATSDTAYARDLASSLGRGDLVIQPRGWLLQGLRGRRGWVILDHHLRETLTDREREAWRL